MLETTIAIALVVGLTEAFKKGFAINTRYAPIISLFFGVGLILLAGDLPVKDSIITGIVVGLSASGLFSGVKKTIKG